MKKREEKEPGLLKQLLVVHYEQAKRRKALRILEKQEWSVEFLEHLIVHAAKELKRNIIVTVTSPAGHKLEIKSVEGQDRFDNDFDIFNHLDDQVAVEQFIRENSKR